MGSACVKSILTKCSRTLMDEDWAVFPLLLQWENFCFKEWAVCIVCICPSYIFIPIYIFILGAWKKEPLFVGINSLYSQLGTIVYWRGHTAYLGTVWLIVRFFTFLHLIKAEEKALGTFQIPSHKRGGITGSTLTGTSLCWSSSWGLFWHFEAMTHWGGVFLWFEPGGGEITFCLHCWHGLHCWYCLHCWHGHLPQIPKTTKHKWNKCVQKRWASEPPLLILGPNYSPTARPLERWCPVHKSKLNFMRLKCNFFQLLR